MLRMSIWTGAAALALAACATSAPHESAGGSVCLQRNLLRSFDAFDDRHVYVSEGRDKHYLLSMRGACPELRNAMSVAVSDSTNRVCSHGFAKLVYREGLSGPLQTCYIDTVEPVASKEHARAFVEQRRSGRARQAEGVWSEPPEEP